MVISFIAFIIVFSIIVLVHEFGHFLQQENPGSKSMNFP